MKIQLTKLLCSDILSKNEEKKIFKTLITFKMKQCKLVVGDVCDCFDVLKKTVSNHVHSYSFIRF